MTKTVTFLEISLYAQHSPRRLYGATFNRNGRYPIHEWDHPHIFWRFWGAPSPTPCGDLVKDWHLRVAEQWKIWIQSVEDKGTKKRFSPITPMFKKSQPPPPDLNESIDSKRGEDVSRPSVSAQLKFAAEPLSRVTDMSDPSKQRNEKHTVNLVSCHFGTTYHGRIIKMLRLQQTLLHGFNIKCTKMQIRQFILQGGAKNGDIQFHFKYFENSWPNCMEILHTFSCLLTHYRLLWWRHRP